MYFNIKMASYLIMIMISTMMVVCSSSWLLIWLSLEINLLVFTPLLMPKNTIKLMSASILYFLIQVLGSMAILLSLMTMEWVSPNSIMGTSIGLITISLSIKTGLFPWHMWLIMMSKYLVLTQMWLIMVWQKIALLIPLMTLMNMTLIILVSMTTIVGAISGLNNNKMTMLLIYSSLVHLGWLGLSLHASEKMMLLYLGMYGATTMAVMMTISAHKMLFISDISTSELMGLALFLMMLSMGGMPPMLGFLIKVMTLNMVAYYQNLVFMVAVVMLSSLISLFFYFNMCHMLITSGLAKPLANQLSTKTLLFMWASLVGTLITWLVIC